MPLPPRPRSVSKAGALRHPARRWRHAACGALLAGLAGGPARAQEATAWPPRLRLGGVELAPRGLLQFDLGDTFGESRPGGPGGGANPRRLRLGLEAKAEGGWEAVFLWDFGGTPGSRSSLYQASLAWSGLDPLTLTAGVFKPRFSLEDSQSSADTLFLERAAIIGAVSGLAAGSGRVRLEVRAHGGHWLAAAALTGGRTGPGEDSAQRGAVARLAGLVAEREGFALHLGLSGAWSIRPPRGPEGRAITLSEPPELALDRSEAPLGTGPIRADGAFAAGGEAGLAWGRLWAQGEWYRIGVERAGGGAYGFSGWYAQAAWTLLGEPRAWRPERAAWGPPRPAGEAWGALELGTRLSTLDLDDGAVRGGRQRIWTAGLGWWPRERLRLVAQWQHVAVEGGESGNRRWQAVALRAQFSF
jgi:phosphate-selective porin OprO/OprP